MRKTCDSEKASATASSISQEGLQIAADRLLQHDPVVDLGQTRGAHGGDDLRIEGRRDGEEGGHGSVADLVLERLQALGAGGVDGQIVEPGLHPLPDGLVPDALSAFALARRSRAPWRYIRRGSPRSGRRR
jgi:hypothetical protein